MKIIYLNDLHPINNNESLTVIKGCYTKVQFSKVQFSKFLLIKCKKKQLF